MCKGVCDRSKFKVLCIDGKSTGGGVPLDTAVRTISFPDDTGEYPRRIGYSKTELYSAKENTVFASISSTGIIINNDLTIVNIATPTRKYSFGACQRCPIDSFDVDCPGSPQGYCCIKDQVVEDACLKLKG